jgi:hypothetical protein
MQAAVYTATGALPLCVLCAYTAVGRTAHCPGTLTWPLVALPVHRAPPSPSIGEHHLRATDWIQAPCAPMSVLLPSPSAKACLYRMERRGVGGHVEGIGSWGGRVDETRRRQVRSGFFKTKNFAGRACASSR